MKFNELIENVKGWSTAKELDKASPLSQMLKLNEEWGELNGATVRKDKEKIADSVGDMMVVLTILAQQMNFSKIHLSLNPDENGQHNFHYVDQWSVELLYLHIAIYLVFVAKKFDLTLTECLELAWNEIKVSEVEEVKNDK